MHDNNIDEDTSGEVIINYGEQTTVEIQSLKCPFEKSLKENWKRDFRKRYS